MLWLQQKCRILRLQSSLLVVVYRVCRTAAESRTRGSGVCVRAAPSPTASQSWSWTAVCRSPTNVSTTSRLVTIFADSRSSTIARSLAPLSNITWYVLSWRMLPFAVGCRQFLKRTDWNRSVALRNTGRPHATSCLVSSVVKSPGCACKPSRLATCAAQVQSWIQASGLARFDGHAMRLNSQAAMEDLSVSERFRAVD